MPDDRPDDALSDDAEELLEDLGFRMELTQDGLRLLELMDQDSLHLFRRGFELGRHTDIEWEELEAEYRRSAEESRRLWALAQDEIEEAELEDEE